MITSVILTLLTLLCILYLNLNRLMEGEMRMVEEHLNKLCSQHDELMSLLDIYDYIPNVKGLHTINRNIGSKLAAFEEQVNGLQG